MDKLNLDTIKTVKTVVVDPLKYIELLEFSNESLATKLTIRINQLDLALYVLREVRRHGDQHYTEVDQAITKIENNRV